MLITLPPREWLIPISPEFFDSVYSQIDTSIIMLYPVNR